MIDITDVGFLEKKDLIELVGKNNAIIRDLLNDNELLLNHFMSNHFLTSEEVANYLRCTIDCIPQEITFTKIGRGKRYRFSDVEKYVKNHTVSKSLEN